MKLANRSLQDFNFDTPRYQQYLDEYKKLPLKALRHKFVDGCLRQELSLEELRACVDAGVDPNTRIKSAYGRNALCSSATWDLTVVRFLIEFLGCKVSITNQLGYTPLHDACKSGAKLEIVRYLVEHAGADINITDDLGQAPIFNATTAGQTDVVEYLLSRGADITAVATCKWTVLHVACLHNAPEECVRLLLQSGATKYLNQPDKFGRPPLGFIRQRVDVFSLLIRSGADPNFRINGRMAAFHTAVLAWDGIMISVLREWLNGGLDVDLVDAETMMTPLIACAIQKKMSKLEALQLLLERGADPTKVAKRKHCIKRLDMASPQLKQLKGMTLIHVLLCLNDRKLFKQLKEHPAIFAMLQRPDPVTGMSWTEVATTVMNLPAFSQLMVV